jgi:hypothetical protein
MSNRQKENGELRRTFTCPFCGEQHRKKSREGRECRQRVRRGKEPVGKPEPEPDGAQRREGSEVTHYLNDPLKGNARSHAIAKGLRRGWSERKVAKRMSVPLDEVKEVAARLRE